MSKAPSSDDTKRKQKPQLFKPGQSGNPAGRPKGTRNKLSEEFVSALFNDFQEHGLRAIEEMRAEKPNEYVKVVASLIPAQFQQVDEEGKVQALGVIALPVKGSK